MSENWWDPAPSYGIVCGIGDEPLRVLQESYPDREQAEVRAAVVLGVLRSIHSYSWVEVVEQRTR